MVDVLIVAAMAVATEAVVVEALDESEAGEDKDELGACREGASERLWLKMCVSLLLKV